jgi:hypothetical protein
MANTIKQFGFELTQMDKDSSLPFNPFVRLCLAQKIGETRDGFPFVSSSLMTDQEIDNYVSLLKSDLDALASSAKARLRSAQGKTRKLVEGRIA